MKTELPLVDKWADTVFVGNQRTYTYSDLMAQRDADQKVVDAKDAEIAALIGDVVAASKYGLSISAKTIC